MFKTYKMSIKNGDVFIKIIDDDFIETTSQATLYSRDVVFNFISVYEKRNLPVAENLLKFIISYAEGTGIHIDALLYQLKYTSKDKYLKEIKNYLLFN